MNKPIHHKQSSRRGGWLPSERAVLNTWLSNAIEQAEKKKLAFHPVVQEFQEMIENDPVMLMYFTLMFEQQPTFAPPPNSGDVKIKNYHQMLKVINHVLTTRRSSTLPAWWVSRSMRFWIFP